MARKRGKLLNKKLEDKLAVGVFFAAFYISLNVNDGLYYDTLGILFFAAMCYGILSIWKKFRFIF